MAEEISITAQTKEEKYRELIPQIKGLIGDETDMVANMANISAALKYGLNFFWVGFYTVKNDQLVLGPFQGPVACTRINRGKGVCGTAWEKANTIIVADVDQFPGHIACSALSRSEIVIPFFDQEKNVNGVLDVDSSELNAFDETDAQFLLQILALINLNCEKN
jgi:GAF domain-containing protein